MRISDFVLTSCSFECEGLYLQTTFPEITKSEIRIPKSELEIRAICGPAFVA